MVGIHACTHTFVCLLPTTQPTTEPPAEPTYQSTAKPTAKPTAEATPKTTDASGFLRNRAAHLNDYVRQLARKPQPTIELLIVHFSGCETSPTGDDNAPGDSPAYKVGTRVVHERHRLPVCSAVDCQRLAR